MRRLGPGFLVATFLHTGRKDNFGEGANAVGPVVPRINVGDL